MTALGISMTTRESLLSEGKEALASKIEIPVFEIRR